MANRPTHKRGQPERDLSGDLFVRVSARMRKLRERMREKIYLGPTGVVESPEQTERILTGSPARDLLSPDLIEAELERLRNGNR